MTLHNPLFGYRTQKPFKLSDADQGSVYWRATGRLIDDLAKYLMRASKPMRLQDAPGGTARVKGEGVPWAQELAPGQQVFASHCIVCHSSKQPKIFDETPDNERAGPAHRSRLQERGPALKSTQESFWQDNYLSTDRRLPMSLIKTNAKRSMASNSIEANVWEEFSSTTYKKLPASAPVPIWNPFTHSTEAMPLPRGGRGYYRPASLVSVWATAPYLHNNSVGLFNNDPSVEGRLSAFDDGMRKLLVGGRTDTEAAAERWRLGSSLNGATPERLDAGSRRDLAPAAAGVAPRSGDSVAIRRGLTIRLADRCHRTVVDRPARDPGAGAAVHQRAGPAAPSRGVRVDVFSRSSWRSRCISCRASCWICRSVPSRPGSLSTSCRTSMRRS